MPVAYIVGTNSKMSFSRPHLSIDDWLEKLDLSVYRCLLKDYVAVEDILWMSERDLKDIGINNGSHRARISSSLTILKEKYAKLSKEDQSFSIDRSKLRANNGNKSFSSLSPVSRMSLDKPHSGVHSWPSSVTSSSYNTKHTSPRSSMDGCGTEATVDELKKALEKELSLDSSDLRSYAWYHGTILRQRAEELLTSDGDFLVRDCISQPGDFVITCRWKNLPLHFIIKKVILQPDTLYERVQFCFEKDTFDSIPDFITYYVGSKCPLSESSGAIISHPINRTMPLTYYASRYGVQCQIHYAAKKLEKLPSDSSPTVLHQFDDSLQIDVPEKLLVHKSECLRNSEEKSKPSRTFNLTRVGSDPMLSPNTERKKLEHRPNSGNFSSEIKLVSLKVEEKPPPKPSRVPSKKFAQKPLILKKFRAPSIEDDIETVPQNSIKIQGVSFAHPTFRRQISETRFSFLDRPSVSDDGSESSLDIPLFTIPSIKPPSTFDPQNFSSQFLSHQNSPLEGNVLSQIKEALHSNSSKMLAYHMTWIDLQVAKNSKVVDLGVGVVSGLELFLLPQGQQLQQDLLERTECMKLFVAITILTTPEKDERVQLLNKWIDIAIEIKTTVGNLFGFTSIMLGLTLPEILGLHSTWLALRHSYTESAYVFETKLRPTFKALKQATGLEAPNTCLPYVLSLILILQKYKKVMDIVDNNPLETELLSEAILDFDIGISNSSDFGLQLLEDHLEVGRYIMQQFLIFKQNGRITLQNIKYENQLLDIFSTEFHLRMLWGFRGSIVCSEERYQKFQKVLTLLYNKCNEIYS